MSLVYTLIFLLSFTRFISAASIALPRSGWTATADSNQAGGAPSNAIDGNPSTYWLSGTTALPHSITIDMKSSYILNGVSYQPRQDAAIGRVAQHRLELSTDGSTWTVVALGTFPNNEHVKKISFVRRTARYVRFTALSEASNTNSLAAAAEINVFADVNYISRSGWVVSADSSETAKANNSPQMAIDGQAGTIWHSQWSSTPPAPLPHWFQIDQGSAKAVLGLSYTPRQDRGNGRIGTYNVQASNDSTTWTQVASGAWQDNGDEKFATFSARARYFRLNALTEAGNRGPWSSAAEINLIDPVPSPYTPPSPSKGLWLYTINFPLVPAAAASLPNGKILFWSAYGYDNFGGSNGYTQTAIYDPSTSTSTNRTISNTGHDMFCPGISYDFNGRIIVGGGSNAFKTSIYNPPTDSWIPAADMKISRGYQSAATTSDGRIFQIGGSWSGGRGGKDGEIYDVASNTWRLLPGALVSPMLTADRQGVYRADNHGWLFGWKNSTVFQAGPSKAMNWYGTTGNGSVAPAGTRSTDGDAMNGNAVMYDAVAGKILTVGGAANYQTDEARKNAYVITLNGINTAATVSPTQFMAFARGFHNSVVLPDGTVFTTGGQSHVEPFTDTTAQFIPELWNPATGTWTQMNPHGIPRVYHSVALLLPDATVLNAGGGLCGNCGTNHWDGEIFVPPYLLNADGTRRSRPSIVTVASSVQVGGTLSIVTSGSVSKFSLLRLSTVTHAVDTDQRRVPLPYTGAGTAYTVTLPGDPGVVLPGYWFLFAIDAAGTPSVAKVVKVTPGSAAAAAPALKTMTAASSSNGTVSAG